MVLLVGSKDERRSVLESSIDSMVIPYNPSQAKALLDNAEEALDSYDKLGGRSRKADERVRAHLLCARKLLDTFMEKFHYSPEYFPEVFKDNVHLVEQRIRFSVLTCRSWMANYGEDHEIYKNFYQAKLSHEYDLVMVKSLTRNVEYPKHLRFTD